MVEETKNKKNEEVKKETIESVEKTEIEEVKTTQANVEKENAKDVEEKTEETTKEIKDDSTEPKKKEQKKPTKIKEVSKKDVAVANGFSLKISPKQSKYVCKLLKGKTPEMAIARLQAVIDEKRPVPMAALEVGHKKGKGLAGGKFPKNACKGIMEIIKQAGANAVVAGIESPVITIARSDRASAPFRRAGRKAKRTHVHIEVMDKTKLIKKTRKGIPSKKRTNVPASSGKK